MDDQKLRSLDKSILTKGDHMIYAGTQGHVFSFDEIKGVELWRVRLTTGKFFNAASSGDISIIVLENSLVVGCNGHVWGLDKQTGDTLWHNGLVGLGNGFISLANESTSVQFIHKHTHSQS